MKRILFAFAWCLLVAVWPAQAQSAPTLASLDVSVWPEYDRPEVLVIYRGQLPSGTSLPVPVEIRLPARVGSPFVVAYVDQAGQRLNQQYTTQVEGDSLVVKFDLQGLGFQLEYYDPLPVDSNGKRQYTFNYTADLAVQALSLDFQVPPTAQGFTLAPPAGSVQQQADGLTYHVVDAGALAQGETRSWALTYQKANSDLTQPATGQAETQAPAATAPASSGSTPLISLLALVVLVAVGTGAFWLGRRTQLSPEPPVVPARRRPRQAGKGRDSTSRSLPVSSPAASDEALFCYQCGTSLRSDAEFCHHCGAAVRR